MMAAMDGRDGDGADVGADPVTLAARIDTTRTCPRCGTEFELARRGPGRRPVWCSGACRRLASAERVAARNAGAAVRVVEVPRAHRPDPDARLAIPSMPTLARLFLSSQTHCRQLLETLVYRYTHDELGPELRSAMDTFGASIAGQHALDNDPVYRTARDDVQRLRRHLQLEADRGEDRRRELAALRAELSAKTAIVAHLRDELNRTTIPVLETVEEIWGRTGGPSLSRQQRRAAARDARKTR
jgi:hypothetical protein